MEAENMRDIIFGPQAVDSVANVKRGISYGEKISIPVDWTSKSFIFEKNGYKTNGFIFLDSVVREYIVTKDQELMTILKAYVADWIRQNPSYVAMTWPWYDDAIARRVQRMSYYYSEFGECFDAGEIAELRRSLDMQARVLLDDSCYRFKHNHGMFMDLALICYALLVCDDSAFKEQCLDKACERMLAYFEYVFTDDGVHKEHSPSYAREISHVAAVVSRVMMDVRPRFANSIFKYGECASKWLTALTMPNGVHPSIGDSPYLKYDALPPEDVVFKHGGYAVFRSSWTDPADVATWILFMAATHNGTHKHSDDLSFLLYHGGDLIVEAGYRNYNFLDPDTAYAYSGYGHNVLCVNDNEFPVKINQKGFRAILPDALKTRIMDSDVSGGVKTVTGRQERFSNVVQQRTLRYDKTRKVVEIDDVLEAKEALKATLIFHLAPGIAVLQTGDKLQFFRGDVLVATMSIASESEFSVHTLLANEADSPYRTSIFVNNLTMKDGPTVLVDVKCDKGESRVLSRIQLEDLGPRRSFDVIGSYDVIGRYNVTVGSGSLTVTGCLESDGGGGENPKAAVLLVRFFDKHGRCLGSGDLVPSEIFKCGYMYLPSNRDFKRCVVIPKDGTRAEFRVVRFSSGSSLKLKDLRVLSGM